MNWSNYNYEIDVYNLNLSQVLSDNKLIELINSPFTEELTHLESDKKINIDSVTSDIKNLSIITRTIPIELVNKFKVNLQLFLNLNILKLSSL